MTKSDLLKFIRKHTLAVQASASLQLSPQAALIGFVITDNFEIFFDTSEMSRKVKNLRDNPKIAFVIGGWTQKDECTVHFEGITDEPTGDYLITLKELYFKSFPDGRLRQAWKDILYFRVKPTWIRYSNFNEPQKIVEFIFPENEN